MAIDYKQAGVNIEQGDALVDWLKKNQPKSWPHQEKLIGGIGGFSALFRADFQQMSEPCLVSCTDGVGTKIKLASYFNSYKEVGQDLVAMSVNDLICVGAQPLFFLDYYATGKLESQKAQEFLLGVQNACIESDLALIGGETAEMPGVYQPGDFDCAGFCVGVVDRPKAFGSERVKTGDQLIALASSGFHSNGFSLVRKVFENDLDQFREILLQPTALYVKPIQMLMKKQIPIHAIANITGGGLDNILRVLPENMGLELLPWSVPECFLEVKKRSELGWSEMLRTLNCGIGMVLIVPPEVSDEILKTFNENNQRAFQFGKVKSSENKSWTLDFAALDAINSAKGGS